MTRIFEALQQSALDGDTYDNVVDFPRPGAELMDERIRRKLIDLYRAVEIRSPLETGAILQFLGVERGAGASRLLRGLAVALADSLGKSVLIVDADRELPHIEHFSLAPTLSWGQAIRDGRSIEETIYQLDQTNLYVSQAYTDAETADAFLDPRRGVEHFDYARQAFDLALVDPGPSNESSDGVAMSSLLDGTIIVAEAEKTRLQVTRDLKEQIEKRDGYLLGVILNHRRFHIPEAIYRRL